jgi:hypothetical protein
MYWVVEGKVWKGFINEEVFNSRSIIIC